MTMLTHEARGPAITTHELPQIRFVDSVWASLVHLFRVIERQRQRSMLLDLDDRLLDDIGRSRQEALNEGRKRFWQ